MMNGICKKHGYPLNIFGGCLKCDAKKVSTENEMSETKELKILEDYLEYVHQHTDGNCPVCHAKDYPVNGDKRGYDEVLPEDAEEYNCDHDEDCAVTVIEKFITAWNTRKIEAELAGALEQIIRTYKSENKYNNVGDAPNMAKIAEQALEKYKSK